MPLDCSIAFYVALATGFDSEKKISGMSAKRYLKRIRCQGNIYLSAQAFHASLQIFLSGATKAYLRNTIFISGYHIRAKREATAAQEIVSLPQVFSKAYAYSLTKKGMDINILVNALPSLTYHN
jgi:hypothetical protein